MTFKHELELQKAGSLGYIFCRDKTCREDNEAISRPAGACRASGIGHKDRQNAKMITTHKKNLNL